MKVSIIIPIYNAEPYIRRSFQSVIAQTYSDIECIFIDDCSVDESMHIVKQLINEYNGNIQFKIVHHQYNQGPSSSRNTGMTVATGEFIYFMDSDDAISSDCLQTLTNLAEKYPDADYVQGEIMSGSPELMEGQTDADVPEYCNDKRLLEKIILSKTHRTAWNRLIKHTFLQKYSLFFPEGILMEDHYWNYFVARQVHAVAFAHNGTYYYYKNGGSLINSPSKISLINRYSSYIIVANDLIEDMLHRSDLQQCHRTYVSEAIVFCMINLAKLHSLHHWRKFWKFSYRTAWKLRNRFSWNRLIFFLCIMPPLCFMIKINGWKWRLREFIANKI